VLDFLGIVPYSRPAAPGARSPDRRFAVIPPLGFGSISVVIMAKSKHLSVRFSTNEFTRVTAAAESLGMTCAALVRLQALRAADGAPEPRPTFHAVALKRPSAKLARKVGTCFTDEEFEALDEHARACGLTVSNLIRRLIVGLKPIARRPLAHSAIVALNRAGATLNQLVELANRGTLLPPDLMHAVAGLLREIRALRDALLEADAASIRVRRE
jgi:hypothetical protein